MAFSSPFQRLAAAGASGSFAVATWRISGSRRNSGEACAMALPAVLTT